MSDVTSTLGRSRNSFHVHEKVLVDQAETPKSRRYLSMLDTVLDSSDNRALREVPGAACLRPPTRSRATAGRHSRPTPTIPAPPAPRSRARASRVAPPRAAAEDPDSP